MSRSPLGAFRAMRVLAALVVVLAVLARLLLPHALPPRRPGPAPAATTGASTPDAPGAQAATAGTGAGFRSAGRLHEHFEKHGRDVGAASEEEYLRMARRLRDRPAGGDVLELVRGDGVTCRFDRASACFIAFERDGTIRTFFRPNDGEAYFRRQATRSAGAP